MFPRRKKKMPDDEQTKADMTPMIDLIFLLLVFFILTTKFIPEEKMIVGLLPNKGGIGPAPIEKVEPIKVRLYPAAATQGMNVALLDQAWYHSQRDHRVMVRIGNGDGVIIDGRHLSSPDPDINKAALEEIHAYIHQHLQANEVEGFDRDEQGAVEIHAFSGLEWKFALSAFDAVRDYENGFYDGELTDADMMADAREVRFAPPNMRGGSNVAMGEELDRIINR